MALLTRQGGYTQTEQTLGWYFETLMTEQREKKTGKLDFIQMSQQQERLEAVFRAKPGTLHFDDSRQ